MLFVLFLFNLIFIYFFYYIGTWYFTLIPLIFLIFLIFNLTDFFDAKNENDNSFDLKDFLVKNLFIFAWFLILIGVSGVLVEGNFLNLDYVYVWLYIILINIILFAISFLVNYKDGTLIFHFGYYFSVVVFGYFCFFELNFDNFIDVIFSIVAITFAVYSFLIYIVGNFTKLDIKYLKKINFLFFILLGIIYIYAKLTGQIYMFLILAQVFLFFLFSFIFIVKKIASNIISHKESSTKVEDILEGKKITRQTTMSRFNNIVLEVHEFFSTLPGVIKFLLSFLNIFLIFFQIYLFITNLGSENVLYYELFYRLAIIMFFANFVILKLVDFYYYLQRIFSFFIINFGIYLTIINIFGDQINLLVSLGIGWSILNGLLIFISGSLLYNKIFVKEDYYLWIFSNMFAVFINIYFILKLDYNFELSLSMILLYIGIWGFITYYNMKYIEKNL